MKEIIVKSVLNRKRKRDPWFLDEYTLNPYEGCSFNCQYCYIRGSKYGVNMENGLAVKINGPEILDKQLAFRVRKDQRGLIALASATDPYIPAEEKYHITRRYLEKILLHKFPVLIITKSELVLRDLDLLAEINRHAIHASDLNGRLPGAIISFSLSTLDQRISDSLEPGAPPPSVRLETMKKVKERGLMVGVNCIPTLPFISDSENKIEEMVIAAKDYGADYILIGGLTLFGNQPADSKVLFYKFLERMFPALIPDYRRLYRIFFSPSEEYISTLESRADAICKKHNLRKSLLV